VQGEGYQETWRRNESRQVHLTQEAHRHVVEREEWRAKATRTALEAGVLALGPGLERPEECTGGSAYTDQELVTLTQAAANLAKAGSTTSPPPSKVMSAQEFISASSEGFASVTMAAAAKARKEQALADDDKTPSYMRRHTKRGPSPP